MSNVDPSDRRLLIYMRIIILIIALMFPCFGVADITPLSSFPDLKTAERIKILTPRSWYLTIKRDGSATLQSGSLLIDSAKCPAGTFVFRDIYNLLTPKLKKTGDKDDVAVAIFPRKPVVIMSKYINLSHVKQIFVTALQHAVPFDKARFESILKDYPVEVPKQEEKSQPEGQSTVLDQLDKKLE